MTPHATGSAGDEPPAVRGRPRALRPETIQRVAVDLFAREGYHATSVDDVAAALGVGRTTFFRYFRTKSAVLWHDYGQNRERLAAALAAETGAPSLDVLSRAIVASVRYSEEDLVLTHQREALLVSTPELGRDGDAVGGLWARTIADYLRRDDPGRESVRADVIGYAYLGALRAAMRRWSAGAASWDDALEHVLRTARDTVVDPATRTG